eukprot:TRINITY_DN3847_c0_g1_i1.p1 TRINITY_DN3847_c0_g1~~TRINITY_DN3847_c0_g1_i1.p1  ORF type:complete len:141 (+),score=28.44 TRINITY_DN3847_c0_g1_i1:40-423(+)
MQDIEMGDHLVDKLQLYKMSGTPEGYYDMYAQMNLKGVDVIKGYDKKIARKIDNTDKSLRILESLQNQFGEYIDKSDMLVHRIEVLEEENRNLKRDYIVANVVLFGLVVVGIVTCVGKVMIRKLLEK